MWEYLNKYWEKGQTDPFWAINILMSNMFWIQVLWVEEEIYYLKSYGLFYER